MRGLASERGGFTLIEVMMTLFVVVVIVIVGFDITKVSNQTNSRTRQYAEANSLTFGKLQSYETRDFTSIPVGDAGSNYEVEDWSAEVNSKSAGLVIDPVAKVYSQYMPGSGSLLKLRVVLDFQYGSETRRIEYATYIQLGGVGR
ncbi:prepilin-type N-terminal cleavage/methylation domain-containing protein [Candidatus Saccharibacteria bacterium]|nr:prepilin-type N-terminal cleavage/methylation domain-containing protein [Candidatus Saccharibacteria bacterium]MCB9821054.1 prepilin-type N-terminal cleavage/methylation domain-containing protein [Candidatus Nomurabacteria bacterium]